MRPAQRFRYAIFQFGHEIRVARLHFFYGLLRLLGADVEEKVSADGTFQFDQFIYWLARRLGRKQDWPRQRYLYSDDEVIEEMLCRHAERERITAMELAARYTYPLKYVDEVLLPKFDAARLRREVNQGFMTRPPKNYRSK